MTTMGLGLLFGVNGVLIGIGYSGGPQIVRHITHDAGVSRPGLNVLCTVYRDVYKTNMFQSTNYGLPMTYTVVLLDQTRVVVVVVGGGGGGGGGI